MDFSAIETKLGYAFKDKNLLKRALTLSSFDNDFNNQTLEFFGDAVIEFIVSEKLYNVNSESVTEGDLTKKRANIVCDSALKVTSENLGLDKVLIKSSGDTNNQKAVPSAYEAVVAAIYLDGGMEQAKRFVLSTLDFTFKAENFKGDLQEYLKFSPEYKTYDIGNEHKHVFRAELKIDGKTFTGEASGKQQAEMLAAKNALNYLKK